MAQDHEAGAPQATPRGAGWRSRWPLPRWPPSWRS